MNLRKITIENNIYLYKTEVIYNMSDLTHTTSTFVLTVFLSGYKNTPLKIQFYTWEDHIYGHPLKGGFSLVNTSSNEKENVNLNRPKYVRECILYGRQKGWKGDNKIEALDGMLMLKEMGYDISILVPSQKIS